MLQIINIKKIIVEQERESPGGLQISLSETGPVGVGAVVTATIVFEKSKWAPILLNSMQVTGLVSCSAGNIEINCNVNTTTSGTVNIAAAVSYFDITFSASTTIVVKIGMPIRFD